jgi:hypothetical protein
VDEARNGLHALAYLEPTIPNRADATVGEFFVMKILLYRLAATVFALAALYLILINLALNLPATRVYLNGIQPDRFAVSWERAWSLYPLRLELAGLAADGQTPAEQWQVDAEHAAASVSLLPLITGEIRVHDLDLTDVDLRLRPRPRPGDDSGAVADYFPVIRNRDPNATAEQVPEEDSGALVLEIDDIHVKGEHDFWVSHIRGNLPGEVRGSFRMDTRAGQFSLAGGALDLALASLKVGPEEPVTDDASIKGEIEIPPFALSHTKGLELLRLPELDARIDLPIQDLDFLALLMPPLGAMELSGEGRLRGRVVVSGGEALRGTDLVVEAPELGMSLGPYHFSGAGFIEVLVDPADESQADLVVRFNRVVAELAAAGAAEGDGPQVLFSGEALTARLHAAEINPATTSTAEAPEELLSEVALKLALEMPSMQVADLAVYSRLFPQAWDLELLGGTGTVRGTLEITSDELSLDVDLASDEARLRVGDDQAKTDLLLQLRARVDQTAGSTLHLDGTSLRIVDAEVTSSDGPDSATEDRGETPWRADFRVSEGALSLPSPTEGADADPIPGVAKFLEERGFGALLAEASGRLTATLSVSSLGWIPRLLDNPLGLTLGGSGKIEASLHLVDGWLGEGTTLEVQPQDLELGLLDHVIDGQGHATLTVGSGGQRPDVRLDTSLHDARLRRLGEERTEVDQIRLEVEALAADITPGGIGKTEVNLRIASARIGDVAVFNAYLSADSPVKLVSGEANLIGDLQLAPDTAAGELLLRADEVRVGLDQEELSGDVRLDILIHDGAPEDMRFDISGSQLVLDAFRVAGETASYDRPEWSAHLEIERAELVWKKPLRLEMRALTTIKDNRPFLAVLDNVRGEHGWIDGLLEAEDLAGHVELVLGDEHAVLSDAMIGGAKINVGAKGRTVTNGLEGLVYVRWNKLTGALAVDGEERHFHLFDARRKFDAYVPGKTGLPGKEPSVDEGSGGRRETGTGFMPAPPEARNTAASGQHSPNREDSAYEEDANPFLNEDL